MVASCTTHEAARNRKNSNKSTRAKTRGCFICVPQATVYSDFISSNPHNPAPAWRHQKQKRYSPSGNTWWLLTQLTKLRETETIATNQYSTCENTRALTLGTESHVGLQSSSSAKNPSRGEKAKRSLSHQYPSFWPKSSHYTAAAWRPQKSATSNSRRVGFLLHRSAKSNNRGRVMLKSPRESRVLYASPNINMLSHEQLSHPNYNLQIRSIKQRPEATERQVRNSSQSGTGRFHVRLSSSATIQNAASWWKRAVSRWTVQSMLRSHATQNLQGSAACVPMSLSAHKRVGVALPRALFTPCDVADLVKHTDKHKRSTQTRWRE